MYLLYTVALALGLLVVAPYYAVRFRKYRPTMGERLGLVPRLGGDRPIWIHAVSVGEFKSIDPLITAIRATRPQQPVIVSTTTPTGRALAAERDDLAAVIYFPLDLPLIVGRVLNRLQPEIVIMAETEIWPNFLRCCRRMNIPVFMVNGRISDRSFPRYHLARRWLRRVLADYALLGMQSKTDADRIRALGASEPKVKVLGNLKYDGADQSQPLDERFQQVLEASAPLIVAASTAQGEERFVIEAFQRVKEAGTRATLLIAPRRTEQFDEVCHALDASGLRYWRRTSGGHPPDLCRVLVLDTIGELSRVFEFATLVFMGGTLVPRGGHNILEPVRFGKPVIFGPFMDNFRDMASEFLQHDAAVEVATSQALADTIIETLENPHKAARRTASAQDILDRNKGATARTIEAIFSTLQPKPEAGPRTERDSVMG